MGITKLQSIDLSTTLVVIAAYNEGPAIGDVINGLKEYDLKVVVVDDGSVDETSNVARDCGASVVRHAVNLGQGAALQTGIDFALKQGAQYIVTFDADGQHSADDVPVLISTLTHNDADIVFGSRFIGHAENISKSRQAILKLAAIFTYLTTGLRMTDAHNGFRAMTHQCAARIRIQQNRMAHASEIIHEIARHKLRMVEAPVTISYSAYSIQKGQKASNAINILIDLIIRKLYR